MTSTCSTNPPKENNRMEILTLAKAHVLDDLAAKREADHA